MIVKKFLSLLKKYKPAAVTVVLLIGLTLFAWFPLVHTLIRGNGYMYMTAHVQRWFWTRSWTFTGFESAAAIAGAFFRRFYGVSMDFYLWTELLTMLLIGALFYLFVLLATKKNIVAFAASLMFSVNYFGNFDMLVRPCYCYYMERVMNVPFLLVSLIFLQLSLEGRKMFLLSLFFYFIGIGLGHFSFFFTALFLFYPFFSYFFKNPSRRGFFEGMRVGFLYLGISLFYLLVQQINESGFGSSWTFQEFLLNPQKYHYIDLMVRQLVYWSQYPPIISYFFRIPYDRQNLASAQNAIEITPYVVIAYITASIVIYRRLPKYRAMLLTTIFATAAIFYLNAYFGQYYIAKNAGANRYLYFPTFLLSLFWALFFWSVFWKEKSAFKYLGIALLAGYYVVNTTLIHDNFRSIAEWDKPAMTVYSYILKHRNTWRSNTLVLGDFPATDAEAEFLTEQAGEGRIAFAPLSLEVYDWRNIASESAHIVSLRYNKDCECVKEEIIK